MKATQQLKDEHQGVSLMLRILQKVFEKLESGGGLNQEHFEGMLEFFKVFVDRCHHAKEEDLLFPALEAAGVPRKGGPIGVLLDEHVKARGFVKAMSDAFSDYRQGHAAASDHIVKNAEDYIALLVQHIDKEDTVLYPMADSMLTKEKQEKLYEGFEAIERERIGIGRHEQFHEFMKKLKGIYLS